MEWLLTFAPLGGDGIVPVVVLFGAGLLVALQRRAILKRAKRLTPPEIQERLDAGIETVVLDTRSPEKFAEGHIATAVNVPLPTFGNAIKDSSGILPAERDQLIVVVAESGGSALQCVDRLHRAGYTRVFVVEGGMQGWCADRLPLCQPIEAATLLRR